MRIEIIIAIIVALFLFTGCTGFTKRNNVPSFNLPDLHKGTNGLRMAFIKDTPPSKVIEKEDFVIAVDLFNDGASDIDQGMYVLGYENQYVQPDKTKTSGVFNIPGRSLGVELGEFDRIQIPVKSKPIGDFTETYTTTFTFTTCYEYETTADLVMCFDSDPLNGPRREVCKMTSKSYSQGQGSPVSITRIDPRNLGLNKGIELTFTIKNLNGGQIILPQAVSDACHSEGVQAQDMNKVMFSSSVGLTELACGPRRETKNIVTLLRGVGKIRCYIPPSALSSNTAYTAPVNIDVSFGYTNTMSKSVEIIKDRQ